VGLGLLSISQEIAPVATSDSQELYPAGLYALQEAWIDAILVCGPERMVLELSVASESRSATETTSCATDTTSKHGELWQQDSFSITL
jgi:hypothetical protein